MPELLERLLFLLFTFCFVCDVRQIPAGANGILGSSSDRSALILLLSDVARHCVRAGRLSTLPPLDSGRVLNGSP